MPSGPRVLCGLALLRAEAISSTKVVVCNDFSRGYKKVRMSERSADGTGGKKCYLNTLHYATGVVAGPVSVVKVGMKGWARRRILLD